MNRLRERMAAILLIAIFMTSAMILIAPAMAKKGGATIQDGTIYASTGELITVGYDLFGYNYQARMFRGRYCDYDRVLGGPYSDVNLIMKWNDAWLSNMDRDGDGLLDRHYGFSSYIGSGAWETNHMWGTNPDGTHWNYYVKIVAVPFGSVDSDPSINNNGIWTASDGTVIGQEIWGAFAIIFQVSNDPSIPEHGVLYNPPSPTGFGYYK